MEQRLAETATDPLPAAGFGHHVTGGGTCRIHRLHHRLALLQPCQQRLDPFDYLGHPVGPDLQWRGEWGQEGGASGTSAVVRRHRQIRDG
jgi:hypothetical protein